MIQSMKELKSILSYEYDLYNKDYEFGSFVNRFKLKLIKDRRYRIWQFQKYSRCADYYRHTNEGFRFFNALLFLYYSRRKNLIGERLGFDFSSYNISKGLQLYHSNVVINSRSKIGLNLHLHGENVIGNNGKESACPVIGDNVMMGAGSKVFGNVIIANNIKIGAGAIVVSSFIEEGITLVGVPAHKK